MRSLHGPSPSTPRSPASPRKRSSRGNRRRSTSSPGSNAGECSTSRRGEASTAKYRTVGSGSTGHAESVEITYDPAEITYGKLLQIYFSAAHDPTQLNRQGPDTGTQYRSTIFPQDADQARIAAAYIAQLDKAGLFSKPIATTVEPGRSFYPAEDYHQDYLTLNPTQPYIVRNDLPKLDHLKKLFPEVWRTDPVLVGAQS